MVRHGRALMSCVSPRHCTLRTIAGFAKSLRTTRRAELSLEKPDSGDHATAPHVTMRCATSTVLLEHEPAHGDAFHQLNQLRRGIAAGWAAKRAHQPGKRLLRPVGTPLVHALRCPGPVCLTLAPHTLPAESLTPRPLRVDLQSLCFTFTRLLLI